MNSKLVDPTGQPVQKQVTIEPQQALFVTGMHLNAMLGVLMSTFRIPPPDLAASLMKSVAGLLAGAEPAQARQALLDNLITTLRHDVAAQARARSINQIVASQVSNGGKSP